MMVVIFKTEFVFVQLILQICGLIVVYFVFQVISTLWKLLLNCIKFNKTLE